LKFANQRQKPIRQKGVSFIAARTVDLFIHYWCALSINSTVLRYGRCIHRIHPARWQPIKLPSDDNLSTYSPETAYTVRASAIPAIATDVTVACMACPSVCLSNSCTLLKQWDGMRCHLTETLVWQALLQLLHPISGRSNQGRQPKKWVEKYAWKKPCVLGTYILKKQWLLYMRQPSGSVYLQNDERKKNKNKNVFCRMMWSRESLHNSTDELTIKLECSCFQLLMGQKVHTLSSCNHFCYNILLTPLNADDHRHRHSLTHFSAIRTVYYKPPATSTIFQWITWSKVLFSYFHTAYLIAILH